ncbi:hypothetical protein PMAYCL1PPCAC_28486, partial [Pristionchus mayeri]
RSMGSLVEKTLALRRRIDCLNGDEENGTREKSRKRTGKGQKKEDQIRESLSNSVRSLVQFFGFHDVGASVLSDLTTVVSTKLEVITRQMAIIERRKIDRIPQPYSSPLLHVLNVHGIRSYSAIGDYYERHVRATYEREKERAAAAQLTKKNQVKPVMKRGAKKEEEEQDEFLQCLGVADVVTEELCENDENGNAPAKRKKRKVKKM